MNGNNPGEQCWRVAIFTASAIGYVDHPEALYARSLAWGLHERGHTVRMLEERRNATLQKTLKSVGSQASRHVYEAFPGVLVHSFEPRTGSRLMEWIARELSLVDLAIAVDGVPVEIARWIANLDHNQLTRAYLTYSPETLTDAVVEELELLRYDKIFATTRPAAEIAWDPLDRSIAPQDEQFIDPAHLPSISPELSVTSDDAAKALEAVIPVRIRRKRESRAESMKRWGWFVASPICLFGLVLQ